MINGQWIMDMDNEECLFYTSQLFNVFDNQCFFHCQLSIFNCPLALNY
jgi:hypothetical protein